MIEKIYCVKCKSKTDTLNPEMVTTKNNKAMIKGKCSVCGITKTQFIKAAEGKGILNKMINNLPFEMHLPGHNFTGPGTKLSKRLNPDLTPKKWSKPINRVDEAAMNHDICYLKNKDTETRNKVCDKNMLKQLNIFNPTLREKIDKAIVSGLINAKIALGAG